MFRIIFKAYEKTFATELFRTECTTSEQGKFRPLSSGWSYSKMGGSFSPKVLYRLTLASETQGVL